MPGSATAAAAPVAAAVSLSDGARTVYRESSWDDIHAHGQKGKNGIDMCGGTVTSGHGHRSGKLCNLLAIQHAKQFV